MAVAHKNSSRNKLAVAAIVALMSLLVFAAAPSEACGGRCNGGACRSRCAKPTPARRRAAGAKCPFDALKLAACADVLGGGGGGGGCWTWAICWGTRRRRPPASSAAGSSPASPTWTPPCASARRCAPTCSASSASSRTSSSASSSTAAAGSSPMASSAPATS